MIVLVRQVLDPSAERLLMDSVQWRDWLLLGQLLDVFPELHQLL